MTLTVTLPGWELNAPQVPEAGASLMPERADSFGQGLWELIQNAMDTLLPELSDASGVCLQVVAVVLLLCIAGQFGKSGKKAAEFVGAVVISVLLLTQTGALIQLGTQTIQELSNYGKLLLPVMTSALAAQGGVTGSAAIYAGTAVFDSMLSYLIQTLLIPMVYIFLCLASVSGALGEPALRKLGNFVKWLCTWILKIILYVFTGYMGITGVISGSADAAALKAAKLTISGVVPVVGGILADASEAVLVGAGVVKNAAGIYGILALLAVFTGPFLHIGCHYLLLKVTATVCGMLGPKNCGELVSDYSSAMGLILAMTGSVCLLLLISTVCFIKGVG